MRASRVATVAVLVGLVAAFAPASAQQYMGDIDGFIEYETIEDSPLWDGTLPLIDTEATEYVVSCFPKKSDFFEMDENGNFRYRPRPDEFSRTPDDKDVFSYHGLVPGDVGLANPGKYDCQNMDFDGGMCRTELRLVHVFIHPVNDPPVAAGGSTFMSFVNDDDIMEPNTIADPIQRNALKYPYSLTRAVECSDIDGDRLTFTIAQQPPKGHVEIIEGTNQFTYIPDPGFVGEDIFIFRCDDRLGGGKCQGGDCPNDPPLSDTAKVIVQVGGVVGPPTALESTVRGFEDMETLGKFSRGAFNGANSLLRYDVIKSPNFGSIELLCDGREVYDPVDCRNTLNETALAPGQRPPELAAWFTYTPLENYNSPYNEDGDQACDNFDFEIILEGLEVEFAPQTATVNVCVEAVNDPPEVIPKNISVAMNPGPDFPQAVYPKSYSLVQISARDVDSSDLYIRIARTMPADDCVGIACFGKLYTKIVDDVIDPANEIVLPLGSTYEIPAPGGVAVFYYVAAVMKRGTPAEILSVRAFDGQAYSAPEALGVDIKCAPGFRRGEFQDDRLDCYACPAGRISTAGDSYTCAACPVGTYSIGATNACSNCVEGTYNPEEGASECNVCPANTTSMERAVEITECYCIRGHYGEDGYPCQLCPNQGPANAALSQDADFDRPWTYCDEFGLRWPNPQPGFYVDVGANPTPTTTVEMKECAPRDSCVGNDVGDRDRSFALRIESGNTCLSGYTGDKCAICADGHFRTGQECRKCPSGGSFALILIALLLILLLPVLVKSGRFAKYWTVIDVTLSYTQVCGIFAFYYFNWPTALYNFFRISSAFNLNLELLHIECDYEWDFKDKWVTTMMIPLYVALILVFISFLAFCLMIFQRTKGKELRAKHPTLHTKTTLGVNWGLWITGREFRTPGLFAGKSLEDFKRLGRALLRAYFAFLLIAYVLLSIGTFSMFDCVESEVDGESYLQAAPHIKCWDYDTGKVWGELFPWAVLCTFLYPIGIFLLFFVYLYRNSARLDVPQVREVIGFVIDPLKHERWYYVSIRQLRLLALCICTCINTTTAAGGSLRQAIFAILTMIIAQACKASVMPFLNPRHDLMEMVALLSAFFTLVCGVTYLSDRVTSSFRDALTVINVIVIWATYIFFFWMILKEIFPRLNERIRNLKYRTKEHGIMAALFHDPAAKRNPRSSTADVLKNGPNSGPTILHEHMEELPQGFKRFMKPEAIDALYKLPSGEQDQELWNIFQALDEDFDTKVQLEATDKMHVLFNNYLKPRARREMLGGICNRSTEQNREVLEWLEEVMLREPTDNYSVAYHQAKAEMLEEKFRVECDKIARLEGRSLDEVLEERMEELNVDKAEPFKVDDPFSRAGTLIPKTIRTEGSGEAFGFDTEAGAAQPADRFGLGASPFAGAKGASTSSPGGGSLEVTPSKSKADPLGLGLSPPKSPGSPNSPK